MDILAWQKLNIVQQLGNVGAEVGRTIKWRQNPKLGNPQDCFFRALELLDATINDPKNAGPRRRELCRTREALVDWYTTNTYGSTDQSWENYFNAFGMAANNRSYQITSS